MSKDDPTGLNSLADSVGRSIGRIYDDNIGTPLKDFSESIFDDFKELTGAEAQEEALEEAQKRAAEEDRRRARLLGFERRRDFLSDVSSSRSALALRRRSGGSGRRAAVEPAQSLGGGRDFLGL